MTLNPRADAPAEAVQRLSLLVNEVLASADGQQYLRSIGLAPLPGSPAQLTDLRRRDTVAWAKAI